MRIHIPAPYYLPTALGHGSSAPLSGQRINTVTPFGKLEQKVAIEPHSDAESEWRSIIFHLPDWCMWVHRKILLWKASQQHSNPPHGDRAAGLALGLHAIATGHTCFGLISLQRSLFWERRNNTMTPFEKLVQQVAICLQSNAEAEWICNSPSAGMVACGSTEIPAVGAMQQQSDPLHGDRAAGLAVATTCYGQRTHLCWSHITDMGESACRGSCFDSGATIQ